MSSLVGHPSSSVMNRSLNHRNVMVKEDGLGNEIIENDEDTQHIDECHSSHDLANKFNRTICLPDRKKYITSYGIIVFSDSDHEIKYLTVQRRDSIAYAEFLKDSMSEEEIKKYVPLMTFEEKKRCVEAFQKKKPEELWDDLWVNHRSRIYRQDKRRCCEAFMRNVNRYLPLFEDMELGVQENQWGFPKGRKHVSESDLLCALREFEEETTIQRECLEIISSRPFEEVYTGTDGNLYKSIFYVAHIRKIPKIRVRTTRSMFERTFITDETSKLEWHTFHNTLKKLDSCKQDLLTRVHKFLLFTRHKTGKSVKTKRRLSM